MGTQDNWKKSVGQLLSCTKNIKKIKGVYGIDKNYYTADLHNYPKNNFKNKVIACLL